MQLCLFKVSRMCLRKIKSFKILLYCIAMCYKKGLKKFLNSKIFFFFGENDIKRCLLATHVEFVLFNSYNTFLPLSCCSFRFFIAQYISRNFKTLTCGSRLHQCYLSPTPLSFSPPGHHITIITISVSNSNNSENEARGKVAWRAVSTPT